MKKTHLAAAMTLLAMSGSLLAQTVVTVNGTKIDSTEIDKRAQLVQASSGGQVQDGPQLRQMITNDLIVETVVSAEAKRLKLDKSDDFKKAEAELLKQAKAQGADKRPTFKEEWAIHINQMLMSAYALDVLQKNPVSEADAQARYNEVKARYNGTDEVQLGQIISDKKADIDAALGELNKKKSFDEVAKKYTGGVAQGYTALVDLKEGAPEIYNAVNALKKGEYTKTPLSQDGVSAIFYVNDKRKISVPAFGDLKEGIMADLSDERVDSGIEALMQKAKIEPAK